MLLFLQVYDLTPKQERAAIGSVIGVAWHKLVFLHNQVHFFMLIPCFLSIDYGWTSRIQF